MNDDEDDLYGDLETNSNIKPASAGSTHQINIEHEREEITKLTKELAKVKKENEVLKRNIGTLYRTAAKELQRKDDRILELEKELLHKK